MITGRGLAKLIAEARSISHPDYVPPDYASARNSREKWQMVVKHIGEALWGEDAVDRGELIVLERNKSYSGLTAAFEFPPHSAPYVSEPFIYNRLVDAFGEDNVSFGGPGPKPEFLSGRYRTWTIRIPTGEKFRAIFVYKVRKVVNWSYRYFPTYTGYGAEGLQINAMNEAIRKIIDDNNDHSEGIDIYMGPGREPIKNVGAIIRYERAKGERREPKADAFFAPMVKGEMNTRVDTKTALAYISLKNAAQPNGINQWSGVSEYRNAPKTHDVTKFFERLKKYLKGPAPAETDGIEDVAPSKTPEPPLIFPKGVSLRSAMPLDPYFARAACWGSNWSSGVSGSNSVSMIYISTAPKVQLVPMDNGVYRFEGVETLYNGEIPPAGWEPYLWARYDGDRNDFGIKGCRIGVFPKEYRKAGSYNLI